MLAPCSSSSSATRTPTPETRTTLRALSVRGENEALALGTRLASHPTPPELVLTSPLLRARQTAEAIAEAASAELRVDDRLAPGSSLDLLEEAIGEEPGPVACVGHQPDCSEIAVELTGADPGFPTAGVAELTLGS